MNGTSGELASVGSRPETANAVTAAEQASAAARLRDGETSERDESRLVGIEKPAGPPPAFEESYLERKARLALEPEETAAPEPGETDPKEASEEPVGAPLQRPSATEKAEAGFAKTIQFSEAPAEARVNVSR